MATGTSAILTGKPASGTGGFYFGPRLTNNLPKDATSAIPGEFTKAGYVNEDGVTETADATDEKIKAWGGDIVKIVRTEHSVSYSLTFMESSNAALLKFIFGEDNVSIVPPTETTSGKVSVRKTSTVPPRVSGIFDMLDDPAAIRIVFEDGQPAQSGDVTFVDNSIISYQVNIECFVGRDGKTKSTLMIDDGTTTTGQVVETPTTPGPGTPPAGGGADPGGIAP